MSNDLKDVVLQIGEKSLNPRNDPAVLYALSTFAHATSDAALRLQLQAKINEYLAANEFDYSALSPAYNKLPPTIGTHIVFLTYSVLEGGMQPWMQTVEKHVSSLGNAVYFPEMRLDQLFTSDTTIGRVFSEPLNAEVAVPPHLDLPAWVGKPFQSVTSEITQCLNNMGIGDVRPVRTLSSFILLRSRVVVADLNAPSFGGELQIVHTAHSIGIPVIGVSNRVSNSPSIIDTVQALTTSDPRKVLSALKSWLSV